MRAAAVVVASALTLTFFGAVAIASGGTLRAFLLAGSPDSPADLESHASAIGVLYPTYFHCRLPGGQIAGAAEPAVDERAATGHIVELPRFSCQQRAVVHRILTDPGVRRATLAGLVALADETPYEGLCLDLENGVAADRGALDAFVAQLARRLHARGRKLAVVVDGVTHEDARVSTGFYDDARLGALADEVFVLAWGVHWEHSAPGPIAPLPWVRKVAAYIASLPHARRFVLGVPMYGLDWARADPTSGVGARGPHETSYTASAYQYSGIATLASSVGASPIREPLSGEMTFDYERDGVRHTVYYLDAHAVAARLRVGLDAGLNVGVWRLGSEDQELWSSPFLT